MRTRTIIAKRLRSIRGIPDTVEGAKEIERLTAERDRYRGALEQCRACRGTAAARIAGAALNGEQG